MNYKAQSFRALPAAERFVQYVGRGPLGCWLWKGALTKDGYGIIRVDGKQIQAHRYSYTTLVGPIAPKVTLDHLCRVRACVNPEHLECVSLAENVMRGIGPAAINRRKTHCRHGHEFTEQNTRRFTQNGGPTRRCKACASARRLKHECGIL